MEKKAKELLKKKEQKFAKIEDRIKKEAKEHKRKLEESEHHRKQSLATKHMQ